MDSQTRATSGQRPKIDRAAEILIGLLAKAELEGRYGSFGVSVSVHAGELREIRELSRITHK